MKCVAASIAALALGALACGGGDEPTGEAATRPPPAAASARVEPADGAQDDSGAWPADEAAPQAEIRETFVPDDRVGEILDTEPEGAGLDALIRTAREDADPVARETAVIALGDSEDARALDALIAATEDPEPRVVLAAIDQLSWFDDRRAEDAIRRLVDSPNAEIAQAAREEVEE
jgi:hypothetical protein